jgi:peptide chain release factor 1
MSGSEAGGVFSVTIEQRRAGAVVFRAVGPGARELFEAEVGGHRWQRVPPNEKRGRVHSSTITVAVLDELVAIETAIPESELEWSTCRSTGSGGQHLQKTDSAVQLVHVPTGIQVRSQSNRSQHQNRITALVILRERLAKSRRDELHTQRAAERRTQVGSGMRGDKRRTVRVQDDSVVDHLSGRSWRYRDYKRGEW